MYDFLVVGAGMFGATCARLLTDHGKKCLVIEKREHIAGNCYDYEDQGVLVNKYGGHIFHTNNDGIWRFVNRFAEWQFYEHRVKVTSWGRVYSFPPNLLTFQQLGIDKPHHPAAVELIKMKFYKGYSEKQWGRPFHKIPESIIKRVPIRYNYDDRYFTDKYQGLPVKGYTELIKDMLRHIDVETGIDYLQDELHWNKKAKQVIFTGQIDKYYGGDLGQLEYRSLHFEHDYIVGGDMVGCATMNYADCDTDYTRVMEWKYFGHRGGLVGPVTTEFPQDYDGTNIPYYPVPTDENKKLYKQYALRAKETPWLHFGGRLGSYQYLNMDQAIGSAMMLTGRLLDG